MYLYIYLQNQHIKALSLLTDTEDRQEMKTYSYTTHNAHKPNLTDMSVVQPDKEERENFPKATI